MDIYLTQLKIDPEKSRVRLGARIMNRFFGFCFFTSLGLSVGQGAMAFTYDDLTDLITKKNITSLEALLPELPSELRSNYTLVYTSRSLQDASPLNPRVILFGQTAELACAFNGDSSQSGFDTLECYQYKASERAFDFRQIQFPTAQNHLSAVVFSQRGKSADATVSCSACHRNDTRPNWNGYRVWSGVYGTKDDTLTQEDEPKLSDYAKFVSLRDHHPRYQYLIQDSRAIAPYADKEYAGHINQRPNLRFSDAIGRLNAFRSARILESKLPNWELLAYAFESLGCKFSPEQQQQLKSSTLPTNVPTDKILGSLGMSANEISTETLNDADRYEHNYGFVRQNSITSMAILGNQKTVGSSDAVSAFQKAFADLLPFNVTVFSKYYPDAIDLTNFHAFENILPDPLILGNDDITTAEICPELNTLVWPDYLKNVSSLVTHSN